MYIRQIVVATAIYGFLSFAGFLPVTPALANDTIMSSRFYDVFAGRYVTIDVVGPGTYGKEIIEIGYRDRNAGKPVGRLEDRAELPDHLRQTLITE